MLKKIDFIAVLLAAAIFIESPLFAQSPALIDAGKKEGKVVVYGSLENDTTDAIKNKFQEKNWDLSNKDSTHRRDLFAALTRGLAERIKVASAVCVVPMRRPRQANPEWLADCVL